MRYLTARGVPPTYYVVKATPRALWPRFRKLIFRSLRTGDLKEARRRRWPLATAIDAACKIAVADDRMTRDQITHLIDKEIEKRLAVEPWGHEITGA